MEKLFRSIILMLVIISNFNLSRAQWVPTGLSGSDYNIKAFAVSDTNLFTVTFNGAGVYRSTDNGTNWTYLDSGLISTWPSVLAASPNGSGGTNLFAGTSSYSGIFLSTDNGISWTAAGLTNLDIGPLAAFSDGLSNTNLFAATYGTYGNYLCKVFRSTNNGTTWIEADNGLTSTNISSLVVSSDGTGGNIIFAGSNSAGLYTGGVFLSTNNGTSWETVNTGLTNLNVKSLAVSSDGAGGTNLFAGTHGGGVFLSTNNGANWTVVNNGLMDLHINAFAVSGTNTFAGTDSRGVFLSTNNGTSWAEVNNGLTSKVIGAFAINDSSVFAGTAGGVFRLSLSEITTRVQDSQAKIPNGFVLRQNYPNPFNPSTIISFNLPSKSFVSLKVFDIMGREVTTIISEEMPAGSYSRQLNAGNISSGIYFYRLQARQTRQQTGGQAGSFTDTKKLIVLR